MVTDTRINELITAAANKLDIDVSTCPESSFAKIFTWLRIAKVNRMAITNEELDAVRKELEPWLPKT